MTARPSDENRVHPGADDNASGVAVLLELARTFAGSEKPSRSIVFVAFAGEEAGLAGSRHYVGFPSFPLDGVTGVINLDTVGRLFDGRVSVLGTGTDAEWQHIFRGASFVTAVESRNIPEAIQSVPDFAFQGPGVRAEGIVDGSPAAKGASPQATSSCASTIRQSRTCRSIPPCCARSSPAIPSRSSSAVATKSCGCP